MNSEDTGKRLFDKDYILLNNAIDVEHYIFSATTR